MARRCRWQLGLIELVVVVVASLATIAVGGVMFRMISMRVRRKSS